MEDVIKEKIKTYCEKVNMKMSDFSIKTIKDGYLATDGYTSIMFDKDGKASSLPMHELYGKRTSQLIGKGYALFVCIIILALLISTAFGALVK
ncbi:hypothetical protein [Clostridium sp. BL-8]|uniref:hypothetical protein n=1 Tax=Clostridium sp. BL-8 TaxID=349938 RepID=UPI00098CCB67|nr:hypothetical protein [Clostridium sp. BL-8]OOM78554.1 hypothetical protein CLOBL_22200 [Clostridium sp. BL-8]